VDLNQDEACCTTWCSGPVLNGTPSPKQSARSPQAGLTRCARRPGTELALTTAGVGYKHRVDLGAKILLKQFCVPRLHLRHGGIERDSSVPF
jgi:hypothetical protein